MPGFWQRHGGNLANGDGLLSISKFIVMNESAPDRGDRHADLALNEVTQA